MANNNDMLQKTIKSKSREFGLFSCVACKNAILRHTIFVALPSSPNFIAYLLFAFSIYKHTYTCLACNIEIHTFLLNGTLGNYSTNLGYF